MHDPIAEDFANLLQQLRRERGWTQEELAERAGLSTRGISDLERGLKSRPRRATIESLATAFALEGSGQATFEDIARGRAPGRVSAASSSVSYWQQRAFVGRAPDVQAVEALLNEPNVRLVTIVGPGGAGKTRLAERVMAERSSSVNGHIAFVSLASIVSGDVIPAMVAKELDSDPGIAGLGNLAAQRCALLVIDDFDAWVDRAAFLADLLRDRPDLKILVTSRIALGLSIEYRYPLSPFAVLGPEASPRKARANEGVQLFIERARAVKPDFVFDDAAISTIARICARLDGLPLAIELAASRMRLLSPAAILARLDRRLPFLVDGESDRPERHQTMRATLVWSYDLLSRDARKLLVILAVFADGFTLDAAAGVVRSIWKDDRFQTNEDLLLAVMATLVDHSLLEQWDCPDDEPRFRMLAMVREFALERAAEQGVIGSVRDAHLAWYDAKIAQAEPELTGAGQHGWMERLKGDLPNIGMAIGYAIETDSLLALAIAGNLTRFWYHRGHVQEGIRWLELALALPGEEHAVPLARMRARWGLGVLLMLSGDLDRAETVLQACLAIARGNDDPSRSFALQAFALNGLGSIAQHRGDPDRAFALHAEGVELARRSADQDAIAALTANQAYDEVLRDNLSSAMPLARVSLAIYRAIGNDYGVATSLGTLGLALVASDMFAEADVILRDGLEVAVAIGSVAAVLTIVECLAAVSVAQGDAGRAAVLIGGTSHLRPSGHHDSRDAARRITKRVIQHSQEVIGEDAFLRNLAVGRGLTLEAVIAIARQPAGLPAPEIA
ncbi:MAG: helix-turn-helix domain-containing protein [Thermomicrobiales bacterium]